ncbi:MAG: hypothetical protein JJ992_19710, partial [Planctomycetes bacterium]|nr:hypothetical protein [Planctomycetota bacterium]
MPSHEPCNQSIDGFSDVKGTAEQDSRASSANILLKQQPFRQRGGRVKLVKHLLDTKGDEVISIAPGASVFDAI